MLWKTPNGEPSLQQFDCITVYIFLSHHLLGILPKKAVDFTASTRNLKVNIIDEKQFSQRVTDIFLFLFLFFPVIENLRKRVKMKSVLEVREISQFLLPFQSRFSFVRSK